MSIRIRNARVVSPDPAATRGPGKLVVRENADVIVEADRIAAVEPSGRDTSASGHDVDIDARGRVLMPGFVDCHTHACFAGDRRDEWRMKLAGASYLDILASGGGIMSTVRAVRAASEQGLAADLAARLSRMLALGTTTAEVKSGYGLSPEAELKMLRAIRDAARGSRMRIAPTALIGHAIDPERDRAEFIEEAITVTLPRVAREFPGITADAFIESSAWTLPETLALFDAAASLGLPCRVHADQFNSLGMIPEAIRRGFVSVDHLEATSPNDLRALAESNTFGVMLPCCGFHLDGRFADGRSFLNAGGRLAIATNYNPGSAPCFSMPMAIALAVRHCGLAPNEAIVSATRRGAELLGLADRGCVEPGMIADLVLLEHRDERALAYEFGGDPVDLVVVAGKIVKRRGG